MTRLTFGTAYRMFCNTCRAETLHTKLTCCHCQAQKWPAADVKLPSWMRSTLLNYREGKRR